MRPASFNTPFTTLSIIILHSYSFFGYKGAQEIATMDVGHDSLPSAAPNRWLVGFAQFQQI
jgi:hypothetical protein